MSVAHRPATLAGVTTLELTPAAIETKPAERGPDHYVCCKAEGVSLEPTVCGEYAFEEAVDDSSDLCPTCAVEACRQVAAGVIFCPRGGYCTEIDE